MDSAEPTEAVEESRALRRVSVDESARASGEFDPAFGSKKEDEETKLGLKATAKLSFQFCLLWVRHLTPETPKKKLTPNSLQQTTSQWPVSNTQP